MLTVWAQTRLGQNPTPAIPSSSSSQPFSVAPPSLDRGNGFLATGLSAFACAYYFLPPARSLAIASNEDTFALILFFAIGMAMAFVIEALHVGLVELAAEHERVRSAVKDREVLLEELSHRTRNDFANVATLLSLQSRSAKPRRFKRPSTQRQNAFTTIARVHRRLELLNNAVVVDAKSYIGELCADLRSSRLAMRPIAIECDAESHALSLDKAVPLGLIVNESVTNAAKHAFPDDRAGIIQVTFERSGSDYRLTISDNGVGPIETGPHRRIGQPLDADARRSTRQPIGNPTPRSRHRRHHHFPRQTDLSNACPVMAAKAATHDNHP